MDEIWKDVVGYEGYYQVSNFGNLRSVDRIVPDKKNGTRLLKGTDLKLRRNNNNPYLCISFCREGKYKRMLVHRVVALAFLPNPNGYPEVNHKDEDVTNNRADNLEWCSSKYNANYGSRNEKLSKFPRKPIVQKDMQGNVIRHWDYIKGASDELGIDSSEIVRTCKGRKKSYAGYKWEYA